MFAQWSNILCLVCDVGFMDVKIMMMMMMMMMIKYKVDKHFRGAVPQVSEQEF